MTNSFKIGQQVLVNDPINFYFGRRAEITYVNEKLGFLYVETPSSTGNATIGFILKNEHAA